eukprot:13948-Eustigmatos_ZCMA.PRE.1
MATSSSVGSYTTFTTGTGRSTTTVHYSQSETIRLTDVMNLQQAESKEEPSASSEKETIVSFFLSQ